MTVAVQQPFIEYTANGITTVFPYPFRILDDVHLQVFLSGILQASGFTITGVDAQGGGTVVFTVPPLNGAPVVLLRKVTRDQLVDYRPFDPFPAETHERALDKAMMLNQEDEAQALNSVRVADFERPQQRNMVLPVISERINKVLSFDGLGNVQALDPTAVEVVNFVSDATGDSQITVHDGWNLQANAQGYSRQDNEVIYYRWPGASPDIYRYLGNNKQAPWATMAGDWALSNSGPFIPAIEKGAPNGVATLDAGGKVPPSQLPGAAAANLFPVGAIYITATNINPGTFIGGVWMGIAAGRVLIGVGTLVPDTYIEGATGGEPRHTLLTSEMPAHNHPVTDPGHAHNPPPPGTTFIVNGTSFSPVSGGGLTQIAAPTTTSLTGVGTSNTGGGGAHENRQPYLAVYFWQRTA